MKIKWPWVLRADAQQHIDKAFDLAFAAGKAETSIALWLDLLKNAATLLALHLENSSRLSLLNELKRQNDLLKWRLMEIDPEFVRDLEPEYVVVGLNREVNI